MSSMKEVVRLYQLEQTLNKAKESENLLLSLKLYNEILQIKQKISNRLGLAKSYAERGFLLKQYGRYEEALQSYLQAAEIAQNSNNPDFISILNSEIAKLY